MLFGKEIKNSMLLYINRTKIERYTNVNLLGIDICCLRHTLIRHVKTSDETLNLKCHMMSNLHWTMIFNLSKTFVVFGH